MIKGESLFLTKSGRNTVIDIESSNSKAGLSSSHSKKTPSKGFAMLSGTPSMRNRVDPAGTTKEYAACSVSTDKPLWVPEHSCPSCGFTADRDWNAAYNILSRGIKQVGAGRSESTSSESPRDSEVKANRRFADHWRALLSKRLRKSRSDFRTPVETALPTGTTSVPAKSVVEARSPTLKREPTGER